MATNLNILQSSVEVSSAKDSIVITNNNTGNVVNVTGTDVTTVEVSSAGLLGNPGRDSNVLLGNSVYFTNITASGNISASGTLSAGLNSSPQTEIVYYNTTTGELTYGPINNLDGFIFDGGTF